MKFLTITLNPALDRTIEIENLTPGKTNRAINTFENIGGKGINVSNTIEALGHDSNAFVYIAGNYGKRLLEGLNDHSYSVFSHQIRGETRINIKLFDTTTKLSTEVNDISPSVTNDDIDVLFNYLEHNVDHETIVVLSGSKPMNTDNTLYFKIIEIIKNKGGKVLLDADKNNFKEAVKASPTIIKPNEDEFYDYFNITQPLSIEEMVPYAKKLLDLNIELVVVSLGSKGSLFIDNSNSLYAKALHVDVKSTTGAGDSMCAAILISIKNNLSFEDMCKFAVATSAATVETSGTTPPNYERVKELIPLVELINIKEN